MMDSVAKVFGLLGYKPSAKPEDVPAVNLGVLVGSTLPKTFDPLTTTAVVAAAAATGVAAIGLGRRIRDRFSNDED